MLWSVTVIVIWISIKHIIVCLPYFIIPNQTDNEDAQFCKMKRHLDFDQ